MQLSLEAEDSLYQEINKKIDYLIELDQRLRAKKEIDQNDALEIDRAFGGVALESYYSAIPIAEKYNKAMEEVSGGIIMAAVAIITAVVLAIRKIINWIGINFSSGGGGSGGSYSPSTTTNAVTNLVKANETIVAETSRLSTSQLENIDVDSLVNSFSGSLSSSIKKLIYPYISNEHKYSRHALLQDSKYDVAGWQNIFDKYVEELIKFGGLTINVIKNTQSRTLTDRTNTIIDRGSIIRQVKDSYEFSAFVRIIQKNNSDLNTHADTFPDKVDSFFKNKGYSGISLLTKELSKLQKLCELDTYAEISKLAESLAKTLTQLTDTLETVKNLENNLSTGDYSLVEAVNRSYISQVNQSIHDINKIIFFFNHYKEEAKDYIRFLIKLSRFNINYANKTKPDGYKAIVDDAEKRIVELEKQLKNM